MRKLFLFGFLFSLSFFTAQADNFWAEDVPLNTQGFVETEKEFNSLVVALPKGVEVSVQSNQDQNWFLLGENEDGDWSDIYFVSQNTAKSLRLRAIAKDLPPTLKVHFYNTTAAVNSVLVAGATTRIGNLNIVARAGWGADENFRYNSDAHIGDDVSEIEPGSSSAKERAKKCGVVKNVHPEEFEFAKIQRTEGGKTLKWPYQYSKRIFKVVLHHTAENGVANGRSSEEVMRAIYSYHALTRGWGDIGYNYVIDPYGTIYEGRAGGEYVVGGHVYCYNTGTIGVSLMGNFQDKKPTTAQIKALNKLLPQLAATYELDLTASENFHGEFLPNLLGHRDIGATACPGEKLYAYLPTLREILAGTSEIILTKSYQYTAEIVGQIKVLDMKANASQKLQLRFKNTGNITWDRSTWLYVFQPKTGGVSVKPAIADRKYIAAKMEQSRVQPGEIATFNVQINSEYKGGLFTLEFTPVVNNKKLTKGGVVQPVLVENPEWKASFSELIIAPQKPYVGKRISVSARLKNMGNIAWEKGYVTLNVFSGKNRKELEISLPSNVAPGKIAKFNFSLDPYDTVGKKVIQLRPLLSGSTMTGVSAFNQIIEVGETKISTLAQQKSKLVTYVQKGLKATLGLSFQNTGNVAWEKGDVNLYVYGTGGVREKIKFQEQEVGPDEVANFKFSYTPKYKDTYKFLMIPRAGSLKLAETSSWLLVAVDELNDVLKKRNTKAASIEEGSLTDKKTSAKVESDNIRIKLSFSGTNARISGLEGAIVYGDGYKIQSLSASKSVSVKRSGEKVVLSTSAREYNVIRIVPQNNSFLEIENWEHQPAWDTSGKINDNLFAGVLELRIYDGKLVFINDLPLEDYLLGMAEVSASTHFEKMKAMAVLIRTYAKYYMGVENRKFPNAPFDGSDNPNEFQKYLGANFVSRSGRWAEAVKATKDLVVKYNGKLVKTPYFNQSDGRTRSAKEVWNWTNTPYLQSVADPYCTGLELKGHGVGLSGYGAQKAAESGKNYTEIIEYYYQGVEIEED